MKRQHPKDCESFLKRRLPLKKNMNGWHIVGRKLSNSVIPDCSEQFVTS
jgi:hypothetical protein